MRWRARAAPYRAKERANISFFIFIMFFAVFGVIVLTQLLLLERPSTAGSSRSRYNEELQVSRNIAGFIGNSVYKSTVSFVCVSCLRN